MKKVMVISHERSGTHFLINTISKNFGYDNNQIEVYRRDAINPDDTVLSKYLIDIQNFIRRNLDNKTNRIYKSHHQIDFIDIDQTSQHFHMFYIVRDIRDVLTSCYFYFNNAQTLAFPKPKNIRDFAFNTKPYNYPFDGSYSYSKSQDFVERWVRHVSGWVKNKNIHLIRYEDLINNFDKQLEIIENALNIKRQRRYVPTLKDKSISPRKGIIGDWKNHLDTQTNREIIDRVKNNNLGHFLQN